MSRCFSLSMLLVAGFLGLGLASDRALGANGVGSKAPEYGPAVQERLDALRAKGEPVGSHDLRGAPIPPEQNAATIYGQAIAAYVDMGHHLRRLVYEDPENLTAEDVVLLRASLEKNGRALALVKQAAAMEQYPSVGVRTAQGYDRPYVTRLQNLCSLLTFSVWLHVRDGQLAQAYQECLVQLRMAEQYGGLPTMIDYLVQTSLIGTAGLSVKHLLGAAWVERVDLSPLAAILQKLEQADPFTDAFKGERAAEWDMLNRMLSDKASQPGGLGGEAIKHWFERERLTLLDVFEQAIALTRKPYYETQEGRREFEALFQLSRETPPLPLSMALVPAPSRMLTQSAYRQTYLRHMALGIELEMHRRSTGSYPDSLAELKPTYFKELPLDPFSGQPFHYGKEGKGYLLYSVGENGEDDQGLSEWRRSFEIDEEMGVEREVHVADDIAWSVGIASKAGLDTSRYLGVR